MEVEQPRRKRKWWIWLMGAVLVVAIGVTAAFSKLNTNTFFFLNRFHAEIATPGKDKFYCPPGCKVVVYILDRESGRKMLQAIDEELTKSKGFQRQDNGAPDHIISFERISPRNEEGAVVLHEPRAHELLEFAGIKANVPDGGCIVYVVRKTTWVERQMDAAKRFLHWD